MGFNQGQGMPFFLKLEYLKYGFINIFFKTMFLIYKYPMKD
jgi:hypothetical protein